MRKKIFIIHGQGARDGIGRETGGDLDTIASNAFYTVWAKNAIKKELLKEPVPGADYDYDFINYSEGLNHLAVHKGCDVYIPDFPVDAFAARLKLIRIPDKSSAVLLNKFTRDLFDFRIRITENSSAVAFKRKQIFNEAFNYVSKITDYKEVSALKIANCVLSLIRLFLEVSLFAVKEESTQKVKFETAQAAILDAFAGARFHSAKKNILKLMTSDVKYDMSEIAEKKEEILAFDEAHNNDLTSRGRIGYTDEMLILAAETVSFLVRGYDDLRELPFDEKHRNAFSGIVSAIARELTDLFSDLKKKVAESSGIIGDADGKLNEALREIDEAVKVINGLRDYRHPAKKKGGGFPVTVMLIEEATGRAVGGIDVAFERWKGKGKILDEAGCEIGEKRASVATDEYGVASALYMPSADDENFQINVTYDGLHVMLFPGKAADETSSSAGGDYLPAEDEGEKEEFDKTSGDTAGLAQKLSLTLIERMFRFLKENDVNVVSINDHHPYTPEVFELLMRLKSEGIIGNVQVYAKPRGIDESDSEKKCGADLIYEERIKGKRWDNGGLQFLKDMAHVQDLHLPKKCWPRSVDEKARALAIELSKLIGSSFNKIEMTSRLAEISSKKDLENIMTTSGWDKKVKEYEDGLAVVLPRTETNMLYLSLLKAPPAGDYSKNLLFTDKIKKIFMTPKRPEKKKLFLKKLYTNNPENHIKIMAVLSPFINAKKGETKINVASAINYLLYDRKYCADYFFYCYGSQIMTTRKPNAGDETINLSTLMQHIGTKADGGHKGAATCQPSSNPGFPKKRLLKVGDKNIIEFLYYIAGKIKEYYPSLELDGVCPVQAAGYAENYERALDKIKYGVVFYTFTKSVTEEIIKAALVKAPRISKNDGEDKPGITQIIERVARNYKPDYIFFLQGGMSGMVLYNFLDDRERLDLPDMARRIGWDEDGGSSRIAIATPKRNRRIPRDMRWLRDADFPELSRRLASFINETPGGWKITKISPPPADISDRLTS